MFILHVQSATKNTDRMNKRSGSPPLEKIKQAMLFDAGQARMQRMAAA